MSVTPTVAVLVASSDEGNLLSDCLAAAQGFDETIVFDLDCTDDSTRIALAQGARVVHHERPPYIELIRDSQLAATGAEWVLFLDPDEVLPPGWLTATRTVLSTLPADCAAVWLAYREVAFGHSLEHTRRGAAKIALVRRSAVRAVDPSAVLPHEPLVIDGTIHGVDDRIPAIAHHGYRTVAGSIEKLARYARHGGVGSDTSPQVTPTTAIKMLWSSVIVDRAYRDGAPGVAVASLSAIGDYLGLLQRWDAEGGRDTALGPHRGLDALRILHRARFSTRLVVGHARRWIRRQDRANRFR